MSGAKLPVIPLPMGILVHIYLIHMAMRINSKDLALEIKTLRSQQSNIDMFTRLETGFLQKFFRYNLSDYFPEHFANLYEDIFHKKLRNSAEGEAEPSANRQEKFLSSSLFIAQATFTAQEFEHAMQTFYNERSRSVRENELPTSFEMKRVNAAATPSLIKAGELIFVDVKIRAEVQKIQEFPEKIVQSFSPYRNQKAGKLTIMEQMLASYKGEYVHFFIVYFGDANFHLFNKKKYEINNIKLMGNYFKLRITVYYVSKQALIETFKSINRIQNIEYINDLVIQFYELKREKQRRKKVKNSLKNSDKLRNSLSREKLYMFFGVCGLVGFGFAIKKLLL